MTTKVQRGGFHSTYKGCNVYRMGRNSWGGQWATYCNGVFLAADTLSGIRQFITETLERDRIMGAH